MVQNRISAFDGWDQRGCPVNKNLNRVAMVACLLLIAASVLFVFGGENTVINPSTVNTRGLGLAAYAELLRKNGIEMEADRSPVLHLGKNDVLVMTDFDARQRFRLNRSESSRPADPDREEYSDESAKPAERPTQMQMSIKRHLAQGGRVLLLGMPGNMPEMRPKGEPLAVQTVGGKRTFSIRVAEAPLLRETNPTENAVVLLELGGQPFAFLVPQDGGVILEVTDATFLRNRFIAEAQNADLALWLAQRYMPPGGRMVFAEATSGNAETRSALDEIGKWATTAFWQAILLLAVVVVTLGRRFGLPSRELTQARGAKELMVAMGDTLSRARRHDHALLILRSAAVERVRSALRLSVGLSEQEIIARMPADAQMLMAQIIRLQGHEVNPKVAVNIAQSLESHLRDIEFQEKARRAPR